MASCILISWAAHDAHCAFLNAPRSTASMHFLYSEGNFVSACAPAIMKQIKKFTEVAINLTIFI